MGIELSTTTGWHYLISEQVTIDGEIYIPFSTIRYNINGSLKQDDYDSMYLYSADYVREDIPATLEDAYKALDEFLDPEDIEYIKNLAEDDIVELHFSLGMWIRNNWLYPTNSRLTKALLELNPNFSHPDDMSHFILVGYRNYLNSSSTFTPPTIPENNGINFNDLAETHWAHKDIMSLTNLGVLNSYEDGTFRPDNNVTHAEMAKIITIAFDLQGNKENRNPDETTNSDTMKSQIKDYSPSEWWSEYALIAVDYYYAGGLSIVYNSDYEANRRQVAVALVNILNPKYDFSYRTTGYTFPANWKEILRSEFVDFAEEDGWDNNDYIDLGDGFWVNSPKHIYLAKTMGLISGYPDGTFQPLNNITRAEFCAMINRALALRDNSQVENGLFDTKKLKGFTVWVDGEITSEQIYPVEINQDGRIKFEDNCPIYELTTDEIWNKMKIQAFGYVSGGFIYKDGEIIDLPGNYMFGSLGDVCVSDLDNDGEYELLYFSMWGSGVNGHSLNCYSLKYNISCDFTKSFGFSFAKENDQNVYIQSFDGWGEKERYKLQLAKQDEKYVLTASE